MGLLFKKLKTVLALTLAVAMMLPVAFAADVDTGHWAYDAIENVVANGIMAEDTQGNFSPEETVTSLEALIVIYRAAEATGLLENMAMGTITTSYEADLEAIGLPKMLAPYGGDVYPAVAYALEMGILTLDEVRPFVSNDSLAKVKKVNVAVFFGKAINAYLNETLSSIVVLNYNDEYLISLTARKYVQYLIDKGIVSAAGDANGNFNPNSEVSRAVLAVMTEGLYEAFQTAEPADASDDSTGDTTGTTSDDSATGNSDGNATSAIQTEKTVVGSLTAVDDDAKTVTVQSASGSETVYEIDEADIVYDGEAIGTDALINGVGATLTIRNNVVTTISVDTVYEVVPGTYFMLTGYLGTAPQFRSLRIELEDGSFDFKRVYDDTHITLDGVMATADDLKSGYQLFIHYDGYDAKRIVAYSDDYTFQAILSADIDTAAPASIDALLENGVRFEWALDSSVSFVSAGTGLAANDIVSVTLKYGVVTKIEKLGTARQVVGSIEGIHIKAVPELTLLKSDGTSETLSLSENVKILDETGDERLTIYDLRLDRDVTAHVGVGGIQRLEMGRKVTVQVSGITATVVDVLGASNLLVVSTEAGDSYTVILEGLTATDYAQGDVLFMEGELLAAQIFEATKITLQGE